MSSRKAQSGITLVLCSIVIIFILFFFYIWVQRIVVAHSKTAAEEIASQVEMQVFFSELVEKQGIDIANKNTDDVEDIIEKFAEKYVALTKGGYDASCSESGIDKECDLTIKLHETLSTVLNWGLAGGGALTLATAGGAAPVTTVMVALKLLAMKDILSTVHDAYLPTSTGKTMKFKLTVEVEFA